MSFTHSALILLACNLIADQRQADRPEPDRAEVQVDRAEVDRAEAESLRLEKMALKSRRALVSGRVVISEKGFNRHGERFVRLLIVFDREKLRVERLDGSLRGVRRIFNGRVWLYDPGPNADQREIAIASPGIATVRFTDDVFHPNILGVYTLPLAVLDNHTIEDVLGQTDRNDVRIVDEELDGQRVKHISYRKSIGADVDLWIAPEMDHAVLKVRARTSGDRAPGQSVHSEYAQYPGGIWYPKRVVYRDIDGARRVTEEFVTTVESAEFNTPVDQLLFELESLAIQPGDPVRENGRSMIWSGETLIPIENAASIDTADAATESSPRVKWIWICNAAALGVAACVVLAWSLKKRVRTLQ